MQCKEIEHKEIINKALGEIDSSRNASFQLIGKKIGLSRERVRRLFLKYNLGNYKTVKKIALANKIRKLEADGFSLNEYYLYDLVKILDTTIAILKEYLEENNIDYKKDSNILKISHELEQEGFYFKEHTISEIFQHLKEKGYIYKNEHTVRTMMFNSGLPYKRKNKLI